MKELSIEEKAEAYERALKEASIAYKDENRHLKATLERIFPELKESTDWSGEDEEMLKMVIKSCEQCGNEYAYYWLKNLKDRVQPQPKQEWSEEDERNASYICAALQCYYRLREDRNNTNGQENLDKARNWLYNKLKSLRPKSQWKPSELQIEALESATANCAYSEYQDCLRELIGQLKKLGEE